MGTEGGSFLVSSILSLLIFSAMQVYKGILASSQLMTIATGFTGSLLFVFLITAVGNLEKTVFGNNFQTKLGEVSATTCVLFSIGQAYALNKMAQEVHGAGVAT